MPFEKADRLKKLPPYLFAEMDRKKRALLAAGKDVINLGVGDSDLPTPDFIIEALNRAARDPKNHPYSLDNGLPVLRESFCSFFKRRYGVTIDPATEIYPLIGAKEGIAHLSLAVLNPNDLVLVPDMCYPVYRSGAIFCGAESFNIPMKKENAFMLDFKDIPADKAKKAKMLWLCYPNNPTAALATRKFYEDAVKFAKENDLIIAQDMAYGELYYEEAPISILQIEGAKDVAIEFHSMSKTFNMTGWRVGFCVGNKDVVAALGQVKANCDSGIFMAIQQAGAIAYAEGEAAIKSNIAAYKDRRDDFVNALNAAGWQVEKPKATFYIWIKTPKGVSSTEAAGKILDEAHVVMIPGNGFGSSGEGYIRSTITQPKARLLEAVERIKKLKF